MSFADEAKAIETRFATGWGSTTPVRYRNVPFTEPDGSAWVALYILSGQGRQASLNPSPGQIHRYVGMIQVQIYEPGETGTRAARTLADTAAGIFLNAQFSTGNSGLITCETPYLNENPPQRAGWYRTDVWIPLQRDKAA